MLAAVPDVDAVPVRDVVAVCDGEGVGEGDEPNESDAEADPVLEDEDVEVVVDVAEEDAVGDAVAVTVPEVLLVKLDVADTVEVGVALGVADGSCGMNSTARKALEEAARASCVYPAPAVVTPSLLVSYRYR